MVKRKKKTKKKRKTKKKVSSVGARNTARLADPEEYLDNCALRMYLPLHR